MLSTEASPEDKPIQRILERGRNSSEDFTYCGECYRRRL